MKHIGLADEASTSDHMQSVGREQNVQVCFMLNYLEALSRNECDSENRTAVFTLLSRIPVRTQRLCDKRLLAHW